MKRYRINYYFDGAGLAVVKAKNKREARQKFYDDDVESNDDDYGSNYVIESVEEDIYELKN